MIARLVAISSECVNTTNMTYFELLLKIYNYFALRLCKINLV
jgi:hypothetical protein